MDSVAGLDMMCNSDLTPEGQETIRKSKDAPGVMTTNGTTHTTAGATAHVYDLDTFIEVQRLKNHTRYARRKMVRRKRLFV